MRDFLLDLGFSDRSVTPRIHRMALRQEDRGIHVMHFLNKPEEITVAVFEYNHISEDWEVTVEKSFAGKDILEARLFVGSLI